MKKIIAGLIVIFTSPYPSYLIFQVIKNLKEGELSRNLDFAPINAYQAFMEMSVVKAISLIWCLWILYMLAMMLNNLQGSHGSKQLKITNKISIPAPAGHGEFGTARFATLKEFKKHEAVSVYKNTGYNYLSKSGIVVGKEQKRFKENIVIISDDRHILLIGATRSGKDRRILLPSVWMQILSGESGLIFDPKGESYAYTSAFAEENDYQVVVLDLRDPECGNHYNFLQPIIDDVERKDISNAIDHTWDLVSLLVGEQKGEAIWYNGECATIAATILIVVLEAPRKFQNLTNVYYFLAFMVEMDDFGEMYFSKYLDRFPDTHPAKGVFKMATVAPSRTRGSFFTSALGTLRHFTNPKIAEMTSKTDVPFEDIVHKKTMIYLIVPDEKTTLYSLGTLYISQLYIVLTENAIKNGNRVPIDWRIFANEFGQYPTIPDFPSYMSVGAGRGIRFVIALQDYQQLKSKYKESYEIIKGNCHTLLYLKCPAVDTNTEISKTLDKYTIQTISSSSNVGMQQTMGSVGSNLQYTGRPLLTPGEVGKIDMPYILVKNIGEDPIVMYAPDISKYRINKQLGLGSKKHNQKIMMQRLNGRTRRDIREPELWGIWNRFKAMEQTENEPKATETLFF